jgi:sorting nexin-1/2
MLDRANAFRQHFDLDRERKYKELNLYVLQNPFSFSVLSSPE